MNERDLTYGEKILNDAMLVVSGGIDVDEASETVADLLKAQRKQARALLNAEYKTDKNVSCPQCKHRFEVAGLGVGEVAKAMGTTAKAIDETARLIQFTNGKPDSRPEIAGAGWLSLLTNAQFELVQQWVGENGAHD